MHIFLLILKVIGIVLLCILGLLLFVLILLLASPFSYRLSGEYHTDKAYKAKLQINYLFHMLRLQAVLKENGIKIRLRFLCFTLLQRKSEPGEKDEPVTYEEHLTKHTSTDQAEHTDEEVPQKDALPNEKANNKRKVFEEQGYDDEEGEYHSRKHYDEDPLNQIQNTGEKQQLEESASHEEAEIQQKVDAADKPDRMNPPDASGTESEKKSGDETGFEYDDDFDADAYDDGYTDESGSPLEDSSAYAGVLSAWERLQYYYDLFTQPSMQKLLQKISRRGLKIIRHLLPSSLELDALLGFEDPDFMGKIMEIYAFLYAFYGEHLRVRTKYGEARIDVRGKLKGYFIPGYIVWQLVCTIFAVMINKTGRGLVLKYVFHKGE